MEGFSISIQSMKNLKDKCLHEGWGWEGEGINGKCSLSENTHVKVMPLLCCLVFLLLLLLLFYFNFQLNLYITFSNISKCVVSSNQSHV